MLWAACCLGFSGFLRAGEFTLNSAFHPSTHMTVSDLQADSLVNPTCFKVRIKCCKTDPFRAGCDIYLGRGVDSVCPIVALGNYLSQRGSTPGPLFMFSNGRPLTRQQCSRFYMLRVTLARTLATASGLGQPLRQLPVVFQIILSRL